MKTKMASLIFVLIFTIGLATYTFAAQYTFTPRTSVGETYTDNVFLTDKNTEDDWITDASVGFTFQALGKTSGLDLAFDPAYVWYSQGTKNDTWRLPASLNLWNDISKRTRLSLYDRFLRTEDPQGDRAVVSDEGEVIAPGDDTVRRGRQPYYTNYAVGRVDHQFGSDDSVFGQFVYSLRRDDDSSPDANENNRYAPSAGLVYWFGPQWGTTVDATYTRATFENSDDYHDVAGTFNLLRRFTKHFQGFGRYAYAYRDNDGDDTGADGADGDYQVHAPSVGVSYDVAKDSRFSVGLGYYYQDFEDSSENNQEGFFVNGDAFKLWNYQRWSARLLGQAGLDRSDYGSERLGFVWFAGVNANASYNFTRYFFGTVTGGYRYSDYINDNREDNRFSAGAGLGWLPTRWMTLSLDYTFNKFDSDGSEDYDENRVVLKLTLEPDKPWRF